MHVANNRSETRIKSKFSKQNEIILRWQLANVLYKEYKFCTHSKLEFENFVVYWDPTAYADQIASNKLNNTHKLIGYVPISGLYGEY